MDKAVKTTKKTEQPTGDQFGAVARFVRYSPYKLRPIVDVVRGKDAQYALQWLTTYKTQRVEPIKKALASAVANAKNQNNLDSSDLIVKDIRVDQGPIRRYFKPGAQGRAKPQRTRMCHIKVIVQTKNSK